MGWVCLIFPRYYRWNCLLLIRFTQKVTNFLQVYRTRLQATQQLINDSPVVKRKFGVPRNRGFFAYVISRKRRANQRKKIHGDVFLFNWNPHAKIQALLRKKKPHIKSSLSTLLHSPLQLLIWSQNLSSIWVWWVTQSHFCAFLFPWV